MTYTGAITVQVTSRVELDFLVFISFVVDIIVVNKLGSFSALMLLFRQPEGRQRVKPHSSSPVGSALGTQSNLE